VVVTQGIQVAPFRDPARRGAGYVVGSADSLAQPLRSTRTDATRNHDVTGGFSRFLPDQPPDQPPGRPRTSRRAGPPGRPRTSRRAATGPAE